MRHAVHMGDKRDLKGRCCMETMHRWEDSIKMDLREIGWKGIGWICLVCDKDQ
jgi:hypothetical protein